MSFLLVLAADVSATPIHTTNIVSCRLLFVLVGGAPEP